MLDLGGPDPEGERSERAVRRRVAVPADDRHPRLREAELRADHVDDALAPAPGRVQGHAEFGAVGPERVELSLRERVRRAVAGRDVVVHRREREIRAPNAPAGEPQPVEGLRRGHLVDEVEIDVEQRRLSVLLVDDVALPDPVEERLRHERQPYRFDA